MRRRVLLIAVACIVLAAPAGARAATQVSYPTLLQQVKTGPLIRAIINRKLGHIEIKFRDLSEWEASYPPGAQPELQRILHQRHVRVIFASHRKGRAKPRAVHHHLRYIAAGILGGLVLLLAALALVRRRRSAARGRGARTAADNAG